MKKYLGITFLGVTLALGSGCSSSSDVGGGGGTGGGLGPNPCQAIGGSGDVEITVDEITEDTVFEAACRYFFNTETYVVGAKLTIEPGAALYGDKQSALIITTTGTIDAQGTAADPIVFTSSASSAEARPGDWGGIVLLGLARLSWGDTSCDGELGECVGSIEGIAVGEARGKFGGNDDSHDCGTLSYVRIEYAGAVFGDDNELNGLTVGGCGSDTTLEYIQVHRGLDDGVEFFGGTAPIDHVLISGPGDDGLDWDQGYRGTVDNFIVHHFTSTSSSPNGIEADNFGDGDNNVEPRSAPDVTNGTVIGDGRTEGSGVVTRVGTWGILDGLVVVGFGGAGYDMRNGAWSVDGGWPTGIVVENSCFNANGVNYPDDDNDPQDESAPAMTADLFDEPTLLADAMRSNLEADPGLGDYSTAATGGDPAPDYTLTNDKCRGAFGGPSGMNWTTGWTAFPTGAASSN
jgi:hypothetical protein